MLADPPLLDRSTRQRMDLASANQNWSIKYKAESRLFFFGSGPHSYTENLGYFYDEKGLIQTYVQGGVRVQEYSTFQELMTQELARLESIYPEYERRQAEFGRELSAKQKSQRKKK
jgi:hypothetical protein